MRKYFNIFIFYFFIFDLKAQNKLKFETGFNLTKYGQYKDSKNGYLRKYDIVWKQSNNLFVVKNWINLDNNERTLNSWLVNVSGKKITKKTYTDIGDFSDGLAEVTTGLKDYCRSCYDNGRYNFVAILGNTCGFINERGVEVIPPKYRYVIGGFSNSFCLVGMFANHYYFVDKKGNQAFPYVFSDGEPFRGTIAGITFKNNSKNFINTKGEILIPSIYKYIQPYNEDYKGLIRAYKTLNDQIGFWTSDCKDLIKPSFDEFNYAFLNKSIMVKKAGKIGFIDYFSGKTLVPLDYTDIRKNLNNNKVLVKKNSSWYLINKHNIGSKLIEAEDINSLQNDLYSFKVKNKWGLIDSLGKLLLEPKYEAISVSFFKNILLTKLNSKIGVINIKGKEIINPIFNKVSVDEKSNIICESYLYRIRFNENGNLENKIFKPEILKYSFFGGLLILFIVIIILAKRIWDN